MEPAQAIASSDINIVAGVVPALLAATTVRRFRNESAGVTANQ